MAATDNTQIDDESHILSVLEEIRKSLYNEGNLKEIQLDFPIVLMHNVDPIQHLKDYCGVCHILYHNWLLSDADHNVKISRNYKVQRIEIRIYDDEKELIPMANIIAVYLHELAHAITIGVCVNDNNKWIELEHPKQFYANYAKILKIAEKLNIFTLGNVKDKYSMRNLKRFDDIDSTYMKMPKYCSMKYHHLMTDECKDIDFDVTAIRLTLKYEKQQKISIIKKNDNIETLNGLIKKIYCKYPQLKKKKKKKKQKDKDEGKMIIIVHNDMGDTTISNDYKWKQCLFEAINGNGTITIIIK